ncbi:MULTISPECIES: RseA family anti-sigma factor [Vibrio]|uniref:Anti-sigma-E factor RseA n=1 Tax=Vibrio casei TaxID=673372 RepID=A0A368LLK6_9VIBR|nr:MULTISPECIES: RseA family anti-sigma factor [Vibrio]RCS72675.1 anti-sigma E factor [Vibrio casei]HBV75663.1 anti-sigma E factor [Vibrio sp.]
MTNKQQISALMDGESVDQSLISEIEQDLEAQQSWSHYHLIGDTLRGEAPSDPNWDIASKVALALDDEMAHSKVFPFQSTLEAQPSPQQARSKMPAWLSNLTQVGVAACVSLVVILGVQQYSSSETSNVASDSDQLPVLQTIPFAGSAEPVSLTRDSVNTQSNEAKVMEQHRRVNALMQDYELQLRLNRGNE